MAALQQVDPAAAQRLINSVIAQPDARLAAGILFFLAALRGGTVQGWLGESVGRVLQRARPGLLSRLGDDFADLARLADEPAAGQDWRIALIPLYSGAEIEQIRMLMRRQRGDDEDEDAETRRRGGIRFILDVELSRLARLQLDGLVRGADKRFDLMVRSARPLPADIEGEIRRIFESAAAVTGTKGGIGFQSRPPDFVEVPAAATPSGQAGLVV